MRKVEPIRETEKVLLCLTDEEAEFLCALLAQCSARDCTAKLYDKLARLGYNRDDLYVCVGKVQNGDVRWRRVHVITVKSVSEVPEVLDQGWLGGE